MDAPKWLNNVAILSKQEDKELVTLLKSQLESYKIHVNPDPTGANYWILLNKSTLQQQIVSIGASTNPRQYQLIFTIEFMLQTSKAQIIKEPKFITVYRQLTINNDRILGSNEEEAILISEMKREAVIQLINSLE